MTTICTHMYKLYALNYIAMDAKKVFSEFNSRMVRLLPSRDPYFTALLTQQGLVSGALMQGRDDGNIHKS